jgi:Fe-S-cluster containining protein
MAAIHSYDEDGLPEDMDDVDCPALDPATRCCDLYEARPFTCRTFGPALRISEGAIGACELCFEGASEEDLAQCAVDMPPECWEFDQVETTFVAAALTDSVIP